MQDLVALSEEDLDLISALQLAPRASWAVLGDLLEVDAATVARHWERLERAGTAWLSCYPGTQYRNELCTAFVEVGCAPGTTREVATAVSRLPGVITAEHVTGGRDLYLNVLAPDFGEFSRFLLDRLRDIPGVNTTRAQLATEVHVHGGNWRLAGRLDPRQAEVLRRSRPASQALALPAMRPLDWALARALERAPRAPYTELARAVGVSTSTARRRVEALLGSEIVAIRCDLARVLAGLPVSATVWASVPPSELAEITALVTDEPQTRVCAGLTGGPANLFFSVWLRRPSDLQAIETRLGTRFPRMTVVDRALGLSHVKRLGRLLDHDECAERIVPLDIWTDPAPTSARVLR